jgi:hypothetical protein
MSTNLRMPDAYRHPQEVRPGCQHQLGCRCTPPFWLRASSPIEEARAERMRESIVVGEGE